MAILELLPPRSRKQVAWFEISPPDEGRGAFAERDLSVATCSGQELQEHSVLCGLSAVVFTQNPNKPHQVVQDIRKYAPLLLDYDCHIVVRPAKKDGLKLIELVYQAIAELGFDSADGVAPLPNAQVWDIGVPWSSIANFIIAHPAGSAPNKALKIVKNDVELSSDRERLVRRAFADCAEVHFEKVQGGQSGVSVYCVYAELAGSHLKRWPLPYFVKIGDRGKIFKEYQNYKNLVDPFVPFHLGPHLIHERCCLGAYEGIIVGDWVEESESLHDCASDGRAAQAIACLFNRTLHAWYRNATRQPVPLKKALKFPKFNQTEAKKRLSLAYHLGATQTPDELRNLFERNATSVPVLIGQIHGDLRAANVRVRATDAIVIDFLANRELPLTFDAASLEASLLIDGFADDQRTSNVWFESIEGAYSDVFLETMPMQPHPKDASTWFYSCLRQIRLYARQMECEKGQYAASLVIALLRKASKDFDVVEGEEFRRAAAYMLAERILLTLETRIGTPNPTISA